MDTLKQKSESPRHETATIPDLRIVPTRLLVAHELHDKQRSEPLIVQLRAEGLLKNPPVVAASQPSTDRYIVLDGANRVLALDELGIQHTLVQVVAYESDSVELLTWYHVVSHVDPKHLQDRFTHVPGLEIANSEFLHAKAELSRRAILAYCLFADGRVITLSGGGLDIETRTELLHAIVNVYIHDGRLDRTNTDHLDELHTAYPDMTAAIIFPHYAPVEVMDLAQSGLKVPPGLTRHIIHGRALRLNYPLAKLSVDIPLEEKNRELRDWVQNCFKVRKVRYYAESTYLFDE